MSELISPTSPSFSERLDPAHHGFIIRIEPSARRIFSPSREVLDQFIANAKKAFGEKIPLHMFTEEKKMTTHRIAFCFTLKNMPGSRQWFYWEISVLVFGSTVFFKRSHDNFTAPTLWDIPLSGKVISHEEAEEAMESAHQYLKHISK